MSDYLNRMYFASKTWLNLKGKEFADKFKREELGISGIVATIILVLFAVMLAAIFWEQITAITASLWEKIKGLLNF